MLRALRFTVLGLGFVAGPLLVRALDQGLAGVPRGFTAGHLALGALVAAVAQPGPLVGLFVTPESGERPRGLAVVGADRAPPPAPPPGGRLPGGGARAPAVGGSAVTALAALFAGALLYRRIFVLHDGGLAEGLAFLWAATALPLAAVDFLRLRG